MWKNLGCCSPKMLGNRIAIVHLGEICGCLAWANTSEVLLGNCVTVCLCHLYASAAHKHTVHR